MNKVNTELPKGPITILFYIYLRVKGYDWNFQKQYIK